MSDNMITTTTQERKVTRYGTVNGKFYARINGKPEQLTLSEYQTLVKQVNSTHKVTQRHDVPVNVRLWVVGEEIIPYQSPVLVAAMEKDAVWNRAILAQVKRHTARRQGHKPITGRYTSRG